MNATLAKLAEDGNTSYTVSARSTRKLTICCNVPTCSNVFNVFLTFYCLFWLSIFTSPLNSNVPLQVSYSSFRPLCVSLNNVNSSALSISSGHRDLTSVDSASSIIKDNEKTYHLVLMQSYLDWETITESSIDSHTPSGIPINRLWNLNKLLFYT